jgi:hypothetical protein
MLQRARISKGHKFIVQRENPPTRPVATVPTVAATIVDVWTMMDGLLSIFWATEAKKIDGWVVVCVGVDVRSFADSYHRFSSSPNVILRHQDSCTYDSCATPRQSRSTNSYSQEPVCSTAHSQNVGRQGDK